MTETLQTNIICVALGLYSRIKSMGKRKNKSGGAAPASAAATKKSTNLAIPPQILATSNATTKSSRGGAYHKFGKIECLCEEKVWIQTNFFSPQECQQWIDWSQQHWEYTAHRATRDMAHRECYRIQRDDTRIGQAIFDRLSESGLLACIEQGLSYPHACYRPVACNPNIRLYQYGKNMRFSKHVDGSNETPLGQTEITLLVYLSECEGGVTRFWRDTANDSFAFAPQVGAILLHVHGERCLEHEADPVLAGTKYVLRSDVCYRRV